MTLPCIDFPSGKERSTDRKICTNPLYITVSDSMLWESDASVLAVELQYLFDRLFVFPCYFHQVTLMTDKDPRKRLFHCVFTDCPTSNGSLGSITPELLSLLFVRHGKSDIKSDKSG